MVLVTFHLWQSICLASLHQILPFLQMLVHDLYSQNSNISVCLFVYFPALTPDNVHFEPVANVISADECHGVCETTSFPPQVFFWQDVTISAWSFSLFDITHQTPPLSFVLLSTNMRGVCVGVFSLVWVHRSAWQYQRFPCLPQYVCVWAVTHR